MSWDTDPFVDISFGKKVSRTRVIRHSLNPTWDEKLLFHVRAYESAFKVQLTVLEWDKLSSNDHVGDAGFMVADLIADVPQRDESTGLYGEEADGGHVMKECKVPLISSNGKGVALWEAKHNPVITFR
jgi:phosphatidylserine decarboxylase